MFGAGRLSLVASVQSLYDPYWGNVVLLMGFENTLADASPAGSTVTATGTITYNTSTFQFDTASGVLASGANYLNISNTSSFYFGTGDFTIETWMNVPTGAWITNNVNVMDLSQKQNGIQGGPSGIFLSTSSIASPTSYRVAFYDNTAIGFVSNPTAVPINSWFHICIGRQSGVAYVGANGVLTTAGATTKNWFPYAPKIKMDGYSENGYTARLDEFRVTNGVWRYGTGSTYPVPTSRFPRQ
jgi:hypothetical protein